MTTKLVCGMVLLMAMPAFAEDAKPEKETKMDEMVVTATRTEKALEDVPASVSVVTTEEMKKRNIQAVDEALNLLPGVFDNRIKGLMGTTSTVTFRGLSGSGRTLLLLDGMPLNNAYSASQQWGGIYTQDLQRIEVVRGPSSNLYGGSAMGGVVNLITAMPEKREFYFSGGYGDAFESGEAMQRLWTTHASYGDRIGKLSYYTALGYRSTEGYPTGQVFSSTQPAATLTGWTPTTSSTGSSRYLIGDTGNNGWWDYSASVRVQYDFTNSSNVRFSWLRAASKYLYNNPDTYLKSTSNGAPTFPTSVGSFLSGDGSTVQDTYTISAEALLGNIKGKFLFGINDQGENWYNTPDATANLAGGTGVKSDSPNRTYFTDLQLSAPVLEKHVLTGGFSFRYDTADSNNFPLSDYKNPDSVSGGSTQWGGGVSKTFSGYLQAEIALHNTLTLYAGLRDDYWVSSDGYAGQTGSGAFSSTFPEKTKNALCPKGALVWKPTWKPLDDTIFRVSGGKAFRAPPLNQLYKTWISTSSSTVYNSNPDLNPETVLSWDAGVEQKLWQGAKIKATYFENYLSDMIYNVTTGTGVTVPGLSGTFKITNYTNVGSAESKGFELEAEQSFGKFLRLFIGYTYNDSSITSHISPGGTDIYGKTLQQAPRHMLDAGIDGNYGPASLFTSWRYVSKRYGTDTNTDTVNGVYGSYDPYLVWDIKTAYKLSKNATVSLSVNNVLNEKYFVYYVSPGRSWFANMEYTF